eukprot:1177980-Rhodomonas_salina.1
MSYGTLRSGRGLWSRKSRDHERELSERLLEAADLSREVSSRQGSGVKRSLCFAEISDGSSKLGAQSVPGMR